MTFPADLTFGAFDSIVRGQLVQNPVVCIWQLKASQGKLFFTVIDGGSDLSPDSSEKRFLMRGTTSGPDSIKDSEMPREGDMVRLVDYGCRTVAAKGESVLYVARMVVVRHNDEWRAQVTKNSFDGYPVDAAARLSQFQSTTDTIPNPPQKYGQEHNQPQANASSNLNQPLQQNQQPPAYNQPQANGGYSTSNSSFQQKQYPSSNQPPLHQPNRAGGGLYPSLNSQNQPPSRNPYDAPSDMEAPQTFVPPTHDSYGPMRRTSPPVQAPSCPSRAAPYPPQYQPSGPVARRTDGQFIEIRNLNSFLGRWIVKGRFINKGEPRTYSNQRGEGKLWSCELMDSNDQRGTIRCTFFNKAVDKFFPLINENEIYTVSKGTLKASNRQFNSGAHDFELQVGEDADIKWYAVDDPTIPNKAMANIVPIADLLTMAKNASVSVCGVLIQLSEPSEVITRTTGQPRSKQEFVIVDQSSTSISTTLWGNKLKLLEGVNANDHPVILLQNARVDEFNGRKLSSVAHTELKCNPPTVEAENVRRWFSTEGQRSMGQFASLTTSNWGEGRATDKETKTIAAMRARVAESSEKDLDDKGVWFECQATLTNIDREKQLYWVACPVCKKKVSVASESSEAQYGGGGAEDVSFCGNCQKEVEKPAKFHLLNLEISDVTGSLRCNAMGDGGKAVWGGIEPDVLLDAKRRECDPTLYKRYGEFFWERIKKEYVFTIQAKSERYRDEQRIKYRVFNAKPVNVLPSEAPPLNNQTCALIQKCSRSALDFVYARMPTTA